jgi:hypothetical protein
VHLHDLALLVDSVKREPARTGRTANIQAAVARIEGALGGT